MAVVRGLPIAQESVDDLRTRVEGAVVAPGDGNYEQARRAWNLLVDQHPAVILLAGSAADVAEGVRFARAEGLGIAVQATGHGVSLPADDCLLIVTSAMQGVTVDAEARTARIEAGVKWGPVLEQAQQVGLAPLLGSSPDVGVIGYTLGGGLGWLARKHGLAADSVRAFEVVTPDGTLRRAGNGENSDLFWALRGGGGAFGVITAVEINLFPVTTVYGGNLFYPVEMAREVFTRYRDWVQAVPDEMTSSVLIANYPPVPEVPEFLHNRSFVQVRGCHAGPLEEGEALVEQWRDWAAPAIDVFGPMPFSQAALISNDPVDPLLSVVSTAWLRELSDDAIDALIRYGSSVNGSSPLVITEVRHVGGGRVAQTDAQANTYSHRDRALLLEIVTFLPAPEMAAHVEHYIGEFRATLAPHVLPGVYINFLEGQEKWERTREAYTEENYRRLMAVKAQVDPDNLMRFSFNIPPLAAESL